MTSCDMAILPCLKVEKVGLFSVLRGLELVSMRPTICSRLFKV